jgi:integrase
MSAGHIRPRGADTWELRYEAPRVAGRRRTVTTTFHGTRKAAAAKLRALMVKVDRGEHVEPTRLTVVSHVAERIETWNEAGRISGRTRESYEVAAKLLAPIGGIPVQRLGTADVERWHLEMRHLSASAKRAAHGVLQRALADAVRHKLCTRNAAADQGPPPAGKLSKVAMLDAEQVTALLTKLEGDDQWRVPVIVALYCGLRRGEQLALKWNRVNLDGARMEIVEALDEANGVVTVKEPKTKAGRRTISLPQIVGAALRAHKVQQFEIALLLGQGRPASDSLVFPAVGGGYDGPRAFSLRWGRAAARLGVPEISWHSLRHSHASMLVAARVPITTIARRLGHANASVTLKVYADMFAKDDAEAAAALDAVPG